MDSDTCVSIYGLDHEKTTPSKDLDMGLKKFGLSPIVTFLHMKISTVYTPYFGEQYWKYCFSERHIFHVYLVTVLL